MLQQALQSLFIALALCAGTCVWATEPLRSTTFGTSSEAVGSVDTVDLSDTAETVETLADVIEPLPGIHLRRAGGPGAPAFVSVRGSDPAQVNVWLDGIPLQGAAGIALDLSAIPTDLLRQVQLYRGNVPVQLGSSGAGGGLYLRTLRPENHLIWGSVSGGSWQTRGASLGAAAGWRPRRDENSTRPRLRVNALVAATYQGTEGDFRFYDTNGTDFFGGDDEISVRTNNRSDAGSALARLSLRAGNWRTSALGLFRARATGVPGVGTAPVESARFNERHGYVALHTRGTQLAAGALMLEALVALGIGQSHYFDADGEVGLGSQDRRDASANVLVSVRPTFFFGESARLHGVAEVRAEDYRPVDRIQRIRLEHARRLVLATGAEIEIEPTPGLLLSAGIRVESVDDRLIGESTLFTPLKELGITVANPQFGAEYSASAGDHDYRLFVAGGLATRLPTFDELFGDDGARVGNPSLVEENRIGGEAGAVWGWSAGDWRGDIAATGFVRGFRDLIVAEERAIGVRVPENIEGGRIRGIEGRFTLDHEVFGIWAGAAHIHTRSQSEVERFDDKPIPHRPAITVDAGARLEAYGFRLAWSAAAAGAVNLDRGGVRRNPGRIIHDLAARYAPSFAPGVTFSLQIENIANTLSAEVDLPNGPSSFTTTRPHADFPGHPIPGRSTFITVAYEHIPRR